MVHYIERNIPPQWNTYFEKCELQDDKATFGVCLKLYPKEMEYYVARICFSRPKLSISVNGNKRLIVMILPSYMSIGNLPEKKNNFQETLFENVCAACS